jgi:Domain of Unknown Function (DUF1080)
MSRLSAAALAASFVGSILLPMLVIAAPAAPAAPAADPAAPKPNTLTPEEKKAGWKLLFDGKSTRGWRGFKVKKPPAAWTVKDGVLTFEAGSHASGSPERGDLMTAGQYESFELAYDWKISEGGNSGVIYHVQESEDRPWKTGPEMQVLDNKKHKDGQSPLTSAGSCYALYPPSKDVTRPVGEWNQARLLVDGAHVEHWLNGEKIVSYEKGSDDWNAKVAASKFKEFPNFGKPTKGFIDFQDHNDKVEYRNIKLRVIKKAKAKS